MLITDSLLQPLWKFQWHHLMTRKISGKVLFFSVLIQYLIELDGSSLAASLACAALEYSGVSPETFYPQFVSIGEARVMECSRFVSVAVCLKFHIVEKSGKKKKEEIGAFLSPFRLGEDQTRRESDMSLWKGIWINCLWQSDWTNALQSTWLCLLTLFFLLLSVFFLSFSVWLWLDWRLARWERDLERKIASVKVLSPFVSSFTTWRPHTPTQWPRKSTGVDFLFCSTLPVLSLQCPLVAAPVLGAVEETFQVAIFRERTARRTFSCLFVSPAAMARPLLKIQRYFRRKPVRFFSFILLYLTAGSLVFLHSGFSGDSGSGGGHGPLASVDGGTATSAEGLGIVRRVFKDTRTTQRFGLTWAKARSSRTEPEEGRGTVSPSHHHTNTWTRQYI